MLFLLILLAGPVICLLYGFNIVSRWRMRHVPGPRPSWLMGEHRLPTACPKPAPTCAVDDQETHKHDQRSCLLLSHHQPLPPSLHNRAQTPSPG